MSRLLRFLTVWIQWLRSTPTEDELYLARSADSQDLEHRLQTIQRRRE